VAALKRQPQLAGGAGRGLQQRLLERGVGDRLQPIGAIVGHRPDERIRGAGLRGIERQQREHIGRAKPLAGNVLMGSGRRQPRRDRAMAVVVALEADAERIAARRRLAFAQRDERRANLARRHADMRRELERRCELALENVESRQCHLVSVIWFHCRQALITQRPAAKAQFRPSRRFEMPLWLRRVLWGVSALLIVLVAAALWLVTTFDANRYKGVAID